MKKIINLSLSLIILLSYSCNTVKIPKGEEAVLIPCSGNNFLPDDNFYRSSGDGVAASVSNAESIAMANALQNFTIEYESVISAVVDNYFKADQQNFNINNANSFEQLGRIVASNIVKGAKRICSQATRINDGGNQNGLYKFYLAYEFSHDNFIEELDNATSEQNINVDFEKFREVYNKEIENKIND
jgi:cellulase/cellobiase CelA1